MRVSMRKREEKKRNRPIFVYQHEVKPILLIMIMCDHDAIQDAGFLLEGG